MDSSAKELLVFWCYPWIEPCLDIFKGTEELVKKSDLAWIETSGNPKDQGLVNMVGGIAHSIWASLAFSLPLLRHEVIVLFWKSPCSDVFCSFCFHFAVQLKSCCRKRSTVRFGPSLGSFEETTYFWTHQIQIITYERWIFSFAVNLHGCPGLYNIFLRLRLL